MIQLPIAKSFVPIVCAGLLTCMVCFAAADETKRNPANQNTGTSCFIPPTVRPYLAHPQSVASPLLVETAMEVLR
ncbi:MAG: hypothetical protein ACI9HK_001494 [Pirellulaceae bacterium]|jgi:hypothetical protein